MNAGRLAAAGAASVLATVAAMPAVLAAPAAPAPAAVVTRPAAVTAPALRGAGLAPAGFPSGATDRLVSELQRAWQITRGQDVVIAVLSTGVASVSGLSGKLVTGPDYLPKASHDQTDGTVLASAIAGSGPTGTSPIGTIGRAPAARILSVRVDARYSSVSEAQKYYQDGVWQAVLARGIRYAVDHGASVIFTDQGGATDTLDLATAVAYAISKNVPLVTVDAPGSYSSDLAYPNTLPGVINASGVTLQGLPGPDTSSGGYKGNEETLLSAPENDLLATGPGDQPYVVFDSYSVAAWVTGTVALIKAVYPKISPVLIARALAISASYHPAGGYDTKVGFGLINPSGALQEAAQLLKLSPAAAAGAGVTPPTAHLGSGPRPGVIGAVKHSTAKLAGYSGAIAVGLLLLVVAFWLRRRWRRNPAPAMPEPAGAPAPVQEAPVAVQEAPVAVQEAPVAVQEAPAAGD